MITLLEKPPRLAPSEGGLTVIARRLVVSLALAVSLLLAGLLFVGDARALETTTSEATTEALPG